MKTIKLDVPSVRNMTSSNGNEVPNQFIIIGKNFRVFQSYTSVIVIEKDGKTYLD